LADINLLPWREQLREEHKRQFIFAMIISTICGLLAAFLIHLAIARFINNQEFNNNYLQTQIDVLDREIKEISSLKAEKQRLLARMSIIQQLQGGRPFVVHLFDEMTKLITNGVYLESIKRENDSIIVTGKAESNSQISQFMRNINTSDWLTRPMLSEIRTSSDDQQYKSDFKLEIKEKHANSSMRTEQQGEN